MKKLFLLLILLAAVGISGVRAQSNPGDFYQDLLSSNRQTDIKAEAQSRDASKAASQAGSLLDRRPSKLKIEIPDIERVARPAPLKTKTPVVQAEDLSAAPFGLFWKSTIDATKDLGVILTRIEEKDYVNSFSATHLPKTPKGFREVYITFGMENELWRILAITDFINDDAAATKTMKLYRQYVRLLSQKYGKQQEFFAPKITKVEKKIMVDGLEKIKIEDKPEPIGNPEFLSQLQSGEASLYSTFEGNNIGAALAINVDGDGKSYIIIDYKNLKILQDRENAALDIL